MSLKSLISLGGPIVPVAPGSLGHPVDPVPTVFKQGMRERDEIDVVSTQRVK